MAFIRSATPAPLNMISINVRCLDDFDLVAENPEVIRFDGRNGEATVATLNQQLSR